MIKHSFKGNYWVKDLSFSEHPISAQYELGTTETKDIEQKITQSQEPSSVRFSQVDRCGHNVLHLCSRGKKRIDFHLHIIHGAGALMQGTRHLQL